MQKIRTRQAEKASSSRSNRSRASSSRLIRTHGASAAAPLPQYLPVDEQREARLVIASEQHPAPRRNILNVGAASRPDIYDLNADDDDDMDTEHAQITVVAEVRVMQQVQVNNVFVAQTLPRARDEDLQAINLFQMRLLKFPAWHQVSIRRRSTKLKL